MSKMGKTIWCRTHLALKEKKRGGGHKEMSSSSNQQPNVCDTCQFYLLHNEILKVFFKKINQEKIQEAFKRFTYLWITDSRIITSRDKNKLWIKLWIKKQSKNAHPVRCR